MQGPSLVQFLASHHGGAKGSAARVEQWAEAASQARLAYRSARRDRIGACAQIPNDRKLIRARYDDKRSRSPPKIGRSAAGCRSARVRQSRFGDPKLLPSRTHVHHLDDAKLITRRARSPAPLGLRPLAQPTEPDTDHAPKSRETRLRGRRFRTSPPSSARWRGCGSP